MNLVSDIILTYKIYLTLKYQRGSSDYKQLQQHLMWLLLIITLWSCNMAYQIMYAINCGGLNDIVADPIVYLADRYFTEGTQTVHKSYIPRNIKDANQRMLIRNQRTSKNRFGYLLPIKEEGRFGMLLRFYEYQFVDPGARVFEVKIGDESILTIDIIEQVGPKKPLTKFIQFQIRNGVTYLQTIPVLNGFNFVDKILNVWFEKVKGNPKIEMIMIVKGALQKFKMQFLQIQQTKIQSEPLQFLCERLHDATHNNVYRDNVSVDEADPLYYLKRVAFSGAGILSLTLFILLLFKDWVVRQLQIKIRQLQNKYKGVLIKVKQKEK